MAAYRLIFRGGAFHRHLVLAGQPGKVPCASWIVVIATVVQGSLGLCLCVALPVPIKEILQVRAGESHMQTRPQDGVGWRVEI